MSSGVNFVSLNSIISDMLAIVRGSKVSQSEPISKRQLEAWVHQYRSVLLKRDLDKGKMPNPDYIQEIQGLKMNAVDQADDVELSREEYIMKSDLALPKTIDLNFKSGIMYVGTIDGHEVQFVSESRSKWQRFKKYTQNEQLAFLRNEYLYIINDKSMKYATVRGIFEIPTEVGNFVNPTTSQPVTGLDDPYPIPISLLPTLKEMILRRELNIIVTAPSDSKNDSAPEVSPNVDQS